MSGGQATLPGAGAQAVGTTGAGAVDLTKWQRAAQMLLEDPAARERVATALAQQGLDPAMMLGAVGGALPQQRPANPPPAFAPPHQPIGQSPLFELALRILQQRSGSSGG